MEMRKKPFGLSDKLGYMFGDFGNDFTFLLASIFLMKFYTDVMGVSAAVVGAMIMLARFLDAFTDVAMGQIADRSRPGAKGKFLPWIRRMSGPVAVASFLMYASWFKDMPMGFKIFWMFLTYVLWGSVFYTSINIPYGSMASAVSGEPRDRAQLSNWRTVGATLAGAFVGAVLPVLVYYKDANGNQVLSGSRMSIGAAVCSILAIVCYLICYHLTTERVKIEQQTEKFNLKKLLLGLATNKPLIGIVVASVALLLTQFTLQGMSTYIYPNYFRNIAAQSASGLVGVPVILLLATVTVKLSEKYGRKLLAIIGSLYGAVLLVVTYFLRTRNAWIFVGMYTLIYFGLGLFSMISWAMITDVIDDTQVRTGERSDGTIYAVYSFARKMGQAVASGLTGVLLTLIGYSQATQFNEPVVQGIYNVTCLVPAVGFVLVALILKFLYPLDKKRVERNAAILAGMALPSFNSRRSATIRSVSKASGWS